MYDPTVGRFLSRDPIGYAAGDANLYAYVGHGPTSYVDPSGLQVEVLDAPPVVEPLPFDVPLPQPGRPPVGQPTGGGWIGRAGQVGRVAGPVIVYGGVMWPTDVGTGSEKRWDDGLRPRVPFDYDDDDGGVWTRRFDYPVPTRPPSPPLPNWITNPPLRVAPYPRRCASELDKEEEARKCRERCYTDRLIEEEDCRRIRDAKRRADCWRRAADHHDQCIRGCNGGWYPYDLGE